MEHKDLGKCMYTLKYTVQTPFHFILNDTPSSHLFDMEFKNVSLVCISYWKELKKMLQ